MRTHILEADEAGTCQLRPDHDTVIPTLDRKVIQPLAILDAGAVHPELAGHKVPFFQFFINEVCCFQLQEDGTWTLVSNFDATLKWAEPFEEGPEVFSRIAPVANVALVERDPINERDVGVWFDLGPPRWVQHDDEAPGEDEGYVYIGRMDNYCAAGTIYVYYNPEQRIAWHVCQFS